MPNLVFTTLPRGERALAADATTGSLLAALGLRQTDDDGDGWVLAKAKTAITAPAGKAVTYTVTAGTIVYNVAPTAALNSVNVAGVIDNDLTVTSLAAGDVFWVQRAGVTNVLAGTGINAAGLFCGTFTTTAGGLNAVAIAASTTSIIANDRAVAVSLAARVTTTGKAKVRLQNIF